MKNNKYSYLVFIIIILLTQNDLEAEVIIREKVQNTIRYAIAEYMVNAFYENAINLNELSLEEIWNTDFNFREIEWFCDWVFIEVVLTESKKLEYFFGEERFILALNINPENNSPVTESRGFSYDYKSRPMEYTQFIGIINEANVCNIGPEGVVNCYLNVERDTRLDDGHGFQLIHNIKEKTSIFDAGTFSSPESQMIVVEEIITKEGKIISSSLLHFMFNNGKLKNMLLSTK